MSFLPGSSCHQSGLISGTSGFGQPSSGYQPQQQQKPTNGLSGASTPVVLASTQMTATSAVVDLHAHHHSQGQMSLGGVSDPAKDGESKITFSKDKVKSVGGTTEGIASGRQETSTLMMPFLKIEDEDLRGGRQSADGQRAGGVSLGSEGQSPSSSLSTHSSPSTSLPYAPIKEGSSLKPLPDQKCQFDLDIAQHNVQHANLDIKDGIQMSPVSTKPGERNTSLTGTTRSSSRNGEEELKESLLGSRGGLAADLITRSSTRGSEMGQESFSTTEKERPSSYTSTSRAGIDMSPTPDLPRDIGGAEDETVGVHASFNTKKKNCQISELPQRTTVRRAMSECSHLAVPMLVAGAYPTGTGGYPLTPKLPDFALMGSTSLPRTSYPHVAVRRSLTVTDGTAAAAAMATVMPSSLMTSPVLPSSPPPKRHHGSCETNVLLPVPPPTGTYSTQEIELNGKL